MSNNSLDQILERLVKVEQQINNFKVGTCLHKFELVEEYKKLK